MPALPPSTRTTFIVLAAAAAPPIWRAGGKMVGFFEVGSTAPLSDHAPNVWAIARALPGIEALPLAGLAMAAAIGAAFTLAARWIERPPRPSDTLAAALLTALALPGLLPGMHWSDFIPAGLCAVALAARCNGRNDVRIAALTLAGLALAITGNDALTILGAGATIAATFLLARRFLVSPANDNGLPLNPFRVYPA